MSAYSGWAIVELMGHRQRAGEVSEVEMCGCKLLRIDTPVADADPVTEFYGGAAIFSIRPCSEAVARMVATRLDDTRPVAPLTLRAPEPVADDDGELDLDPYDDEGLR